MTNFERIKAMSVERLANAIYSTNRACMCCKEAISGNWNCLTHMECRENIKEWLESEVDNE